MMRKLLVLFVFALAFARGSVWAAECGDGVVDPGEQCDPGPTACTYLDLTTPDRMIDCRNPVCTVAGAGEDFVCTEACALTPACRPLLDDPALLKFRYPSRLDYVTVSSRVLPVSALDPVGEEFSFGIWNNAGMYFPQTLPPGSFVSNKKWTSFKYVADRTGSPMIYKASLRQKLDRLTGNLQYLIKVKAELDAGHADPARSPSVPLAILGHFAIQVLVGDDLFYSVHDWLPLPSYRGWKLPDELMVVQP